MTNCKILFFRNQKSDISMSQLTLCVVFVAVFACIEAHSGNSHTMTDIKSQITTMTRSMSVELVTQCSLSHI